MARQKVNKILTILPIDIDKVAIAKILILMLFILSSTVFVLGLTQGF